jgi:hypothetical protein
MLVSMPHFAAVVWCNLDRPDTCRDVACRDQIDGLGVQGVLAQAGLGEFTDQNIES